MKIFPTTTTCQNPQFCCTAEQCLCLVFAFSLFLFPFPEPCHRDKGHHFYQDYICKLIHDISHKNWQQYKGTAVTWPLLQLLTWTWGQSQSSTGAFPGGKVPHSQQCQHLPEHSSAAQRASSLPIYWSDSRTAAFPSPGIKPVTGTFHSFAVSKWDSRKIRLRIIPMPTHTKEQIKSLLVERCIQNCSEEWKCKHPDRDLTPYSADQNDHTESAGLRLKRNCQFPKFSFFKSGF